VACEAEAFCGFMDAEGSLQINIQEDRIMFQVRISIHVDDKAYLLKVQQKLGIGGISKSGPCTEA